MSTPIARTGSRIALSVIAIVAFGSFAPAIRAEEAPTREQVKQLQQQLAEMKKEMDGMRTALDATRTQGGSCPDSMRGHMRGMDQHWQAMHHQSCMMNPGSCPHMGMQPPAQP